MLLILLSLVFRNFWCRYLCPYGALLGIFSLVSPFEITRDSDNCIDCGKCTRNCPYHLPVDSKPKISSPECMSCMTCLSGCPTGAISYANYERTRKLSGRQYAAILLGIFFGIVLVAKLTGYWDAGVSHEEYLRIMPAADSIRHP
jgi:polyferredoxin